MPNLRYFSECGEDMAVNNSHQILLAALEEEDLC